ncbi:dynein heavy chain 9, axonemal [Caerostris extrusa]|uniref:Dynein heavy chain 9, axonemal n=1 Tax=Caerostris extrusa TaxID=172846 RepID=A0AAV4V777_CAEEX|nr:dynein heavy chain 9, axonemal [Caerostris extrusa]
MCPTAGSCTVNPRLQRNFCVLSVPPTTHDSMQTIFGLQLREHLKRIHPPSESQEEVEEFRLCIQQQIVRLAIYLQSRMMSAFHPTALKFHYVFNLRDISNVFRGLLLSSSESLVKSEDLLQLWLHESQRVYRDKLLDQDDLEKFDKILADVLKRNTEMDDQTSLSMVNNIPIHCHFAQGIGTSCYQPMSDKNQLVRLLQDALDAYNDICAPMDLVLFEDAVRHICRITRILNLEGTHYWLESVAVGDNPPQHWQRTFATCTFINLPYILNMIYKTSKNLNGVCAFPSEGGHREPVPEGGRQEHRQPLHDERRPGGRREVPGPHQRPPLLGGHPGPVPGGRGREHHLSPALRGEVGGHIRLAGELLELLHQQGEAETQGRAVFFTGWIHSQISKSKIPDPHQLYLHRLVPPLAQRCTRHRLQSLSRRPSDPPASRPPPKSFLQHIKTYKLLMQKRHTFLRDNIGRLEAGLQRLVDTSKQVDILKEQLAEQEVELQQRSGDIDALLETVVHETEVVGREKTVAAAEEAKVSRIHADSNLTELRSFGSPPVAVRNVTSAVMVLLATDGKIPKDLSWRAAKLTMSKVDNFLDSLINFDKDNIHENSLKAVQTYLKSPEFKPEVVVGKSQAAAGLCSWVINVLKYYEEPKRKALAEANAEYNVAKEKLARIQEKVTEVESRLSELKARCEAATEAKAKCESEAQKTAFSIHLATGCWEGWPPRGSAGPSWPPTSRPWSRHCPATCSCRRPSSPTWDPSPSPTGCSCSTNTGGPSWEKRSVHQVLLQEFVVSIFEISIFTVKLISWSIH